MAKKLVRFWDEYFDKVPLVNELKDNFSAIQEEILKYCDAPLSLFDYPKYQIDGRNLYEHYWKAAPLSKFEGEFVSSYATEQERQFLNIVIKNAKDKCPVTNSIISPYEDDNILHNAFISRLIPGSVINPHTGWTTMYMRIHLGIKCDPGARISVADQTRTWVEGEILAFKDGPPLKHSVVHGGTQERIILSVDVRMEYLMQFVPELCY
jgi:aspartyl/asparaginyl beta-hydroxylase (cupin superfamily)